MDAMIRKELVKVFWKRPGNGTFVEHMIELLGKSDLDNIFGKVVIESEDYIIWKEEQENKPGKPGGGGPGGGGGGGGRVAPPVALLSSPRLLTSSSISSFKKVSRSEKSRSVRQRLLFSDSILLHSSSMASSTLNRVCYIFMCVAVNDTEMMMYETAAGITRLLNVQPPVPPSASESSRRPPWP